MYTFSNFNLSSLTRSIFPFFHLICVSLITRLWRVSGQTARRWFHQGYIPHLLKVIMHIYSSSIMALLILRSQILLLGSWTSHWWISALRVLILNCLNLNTLVLLDCSHGISTIKVLICISLSLLRNLIRLHTCGSPIWKEEKRC